MIKRLCFFANSIASFIVSGVAEFPVGFPQERDELSLARRIYMMAQTMLVQGKNQRSTDFSKKIDVRRGYGPSAAADAKEIHMNMHVF